MAKGSPRKEAYSFPFLEVSLTPAIDPSSVSITIRFAFAENYVRYFGGLTTIEFTNSWIISLVRGMYCVVDVSILHGIDQWSPSNILRA